MGWTYKSRKWRDQKRAEYTRQTGSDDFGSPDFKAWVEQRITNRDSNLSN